MSVSSDPAPCIRSAVLDERADTAAFSVLVVLRTRGGLVALDAEATTSG